MYWRLLFFLIINFAGLAVGSVYTRPGVESQWYADLLKAQWTPPSWVFGAAWTMIMIGFSFYMSMLWLRAKSKSLLTLSFIALWLLNMAWNPIFFHFKWIGLALIEITILTAGIFSLGLYHYKAMGQRSLLLLPYAIWLVIATSLNAYIFWNN